jgi:hypothetical protein
MNTRFNFGGMTDKIVYIKEVKVSDLPMAARMEAGDLESVFAVHNDAGKQIALVNDRGLAFEIARHHHMTPVAVH